MDVGRPPQVQSLLGSLNDPDGLKRLFWKELGYERVNAPLSRRGWSATTAAALYEDPNLFAAGGAGGAFHVVYNRLAGDRLLLGDERRIIGRLLPDHPYGLFVFSNRAQTHWHFVNVKFDESVERRQLFRRLSVSPGERLRTAAERLSMIDLTTMADSPTATSPLDIQQRLDQAFDVEEVQKDFFRTFAQLYGRIASDLKAAAGTEDRSLRWAQLLLDRMLFLYFIQKKGWLDNDLNYLYSRFGRQGGDRPRAPNYYDNVLLPLFSSLSDQSARSESVGHVPFLNGGLFEPQEGPPAGSVSNSTIKALFEGLLERYNFTVTEDTPFDVEVAIDPEMLGKIFESLILELEKDPDQDVRRLTGSYYTPSTVVHFMCQEGLVEHLTQALAKEIQLGRESVRERLRTLLAFPPASHLDEAERSRLSNLFSPGEAHLLHDTVLETKVCDPAVGSGAFLVAMLQELLTLVAKLEVIIGSAAPSRNRTYETKRQIIERCLYGVDIQEQAVRLCELRLWLSLIVDYELDLRRPYADALAEVPSLPNLSYRVVRGDSLIEHLFGHAVHLDRMARDASTRQLIESIQADKASYFQEARSAEKRHLEVKILAKQADLAEKLIEERQRSLTNVQASLFGEEAMNRKDKAALDKQRAELESLADLRQRVSNARGALAQLVARPPGSLDPEAVSQLRRKHFESGRSPSFLWHLDFAEVFRERGGFDLVIANPPYVNALQFARSYPPEDREALNSEFQTTRGAYDLFVPFFERGIALLRSGGVLAYISPNKYLSAQYSIALRELLLRDTTLCRVVDVSGIRVFREAAVYPLITILIAGRNGDYVLQSQLPELRDMPEFDSARFRLMDFSSKLLESLPENIWGFLLSTNSWLLPKLLEGCTSLKDLGDVNATSSASEADAYGQYLTTKRTKDGVKVINTGTIDSFKTLWGQRPMRHAGHTFLTPYLPLTKAGVSNRRREMYRSPKVIFAKMARRCEAFVDETGDFASLNTNCFYNPRSDVDLQYIGAYCNSNVFQFIYEQLFGALRMSGGYFQFQAPQLRVMPVRLPKPVEAKKVIKLHQQAVRAEEATMLEVRAALDRCFYSIFDLSEQEIRVIEGTL